MGRPECGIAITNLGFNKDTLLLHRIAVFRQSIELVTGRIPMLWQYPAVCQNLESHFCQFGEEKYVRTYAYPAVLAHYYGE